MSVSKRIYDRVYTYQVYVNIPANENIKIFFKSGLSTLKDKTIRAISASYYNTIAGQTDQCWLTLVDKNHNTMLYNYPVVDLQDASNTGEVDNNFNYRLRLFKLHDIELQNSYFMYNNVTGPLTGNLFNLNFYYNDSAT